MNNPAVELIESGKLIEIPEDVATCSHCGTKLKAQCYELHRNEAGEWKAELINLYCESEVEPDSPQYDEFVNSHSDLPYVYLIPVVEKVVEWINRRYSFKIK